MNFLLNDTRTHFNNVREKLILLELSIDDDKVSILRSQNNSMLLILVSTLLYGYLVDNFFK